MKEFLSLEYLIATVAKGSSWLLGPGLTILLIIVAAWILHRFIHGFLVKIIRKAIKPHRFPSKEAERKTEDTLIRVFHGTIVVIIWVAVVMMILSELGINIGPLIAGAGIAGLAIGFGAQYLIRDVIAGLFIILQNQYRVGDVVCLDNTCGQVENINLRMTVLRDLEGTVHYISNGSVKIVSNKTREFGRIVLEVGIAYNSDLEKVISVVNKVGKELAEDPNWKDFIIKPPQFDRINDFADSAVIIRIIGETKPMKQWAATGELRKRLKIAFDKEGIEIPFPQRVIHQAKD
jgi:small conductance mechanosensitive channel